MEKSRNERAAEREMEARRLADEEQRQTERWAEAFDEVYGDQLASLDWPSDIMGGGGFESLEFSGDPSDMFTLTQGGTLTMGGGLGSLDWGSVERLPTGAIRVGPGTLLTGALILNELSQRAEYAQIEDAMQRFGFDPAEASNVLAARAYVWSTYNAPRFDGVPFSVSLPKNPNHRIRRYRRCKPPTLASLTMRPRLSTGLPSGVSLAKARCGRSWL